MSEEINQILETLAVKYGTTVEMLMQEIIKRGIVLNTIGFIVASLALCLTIITTIYCIKRHSVNTFEDWTAGIILISLMAVAFGFIWVDVLAKLVSWIVAPNAQAITTIIDMIKY